MASKKLESTFLNMFAVLSGIALISALSLGVTYTATKDAIEEVKRLKKVKAVKAVVPEFNNDPFSTMYTVEGFPRLELYPAQQDGQIVGTAVKTVSASGFSGDIWIMVGFDAEGKIYNTSILEHKETPGLGSKMGMDKFKNQFKNVNPSAFKLDVTKDGGQIDGITAATISSRAFCEAVKKAAEAFKKGNKS